MYLLLKIEMVDVSNPKIRDLGVVVPCPSIAG